MRREHGVGQHLVAVVVEVQVVVGGVVVPGEQLLGCQRVTGGLVEVQGTGEGGTFSRTQLDTLLNLAEAGIDQLTRLQRECLGPDWPLAD